MIFGKRTIFFFIFLLFLPFFSYSNVPQDIQSGIEICNELFKTATDYSRLKSTEENGANQIIIPAIYKQQLLSENENKFPYNIVITFLSEKKNEDFYSHDFDMTQGRSGQNGLPGAASTQSRENFIIVFDSCNIYSHKEILSELMYYLETTPLDFNVTIVLGYGNIQKIRQHSMLYGIDTFISSLNPEDSYTAIQVLISDRKNSINSGYSEKAAPAWLINDVQESLTNSAGKFMFKYISDKNISQDITLQKLTENGIPSLSINFHEDETTSEKITGFVKNVLTLYNPTASAEWAHHALIIPWLNTKYANITEYQLVKMVIVLLFLSIAFITALSFFNHYFKRNSWRGIKKIFFIVPLIFVIMMITLGSGSFILSKLSYTGMSSIKKNSNSFFMFTFQLSFTLLLLSQLFYFLAEFNPVERIRTLDFLVLFSASFNLIIFVIIDIAFLPVFLFIFLITVFQFIFQGRLFHVISGFFLIIPYIPYVIRRFEYEDFSTFFSIATPAFYTAAISAAVMPFLLFYFRCICSVKTNSKNKRNDIKLLIFLIFVTAQIILFISIRIYNTNLVRHTDPEKILCIQKNSGKKSTMFYEDKIILGKKVRNLSIRMPRQCELCSLMITGTEENPVLYSSSDFEVVRKTSSAFKIPYKPPRELIFSYAVPEEPSQINLTVIYPTEKENLFELETIQIQTE